MSSIDAMTPPPRMYLELDPREGYPAGKDIEYECGLCGGIVASMPANEVAWDCGCRNVRVDGDAGRVSVDDPRGFRAFRR